VAWLFTRITSQESATTIPRLALYILYFTIREEVIFDWGKMISTKISTQLLNFKKDKEFYMDSYLIIVITYCHVFKGLSIRKRVECKIDPVTMWYQALSRQKVIYCFYEVYNEFVYVFKKLVFGENTSRLSCETSTFLDKKGTIEKMDNYNIVRIFFSRERPLFLPYYILDRLFSIEVAR
jgi:hypothetical protein